MHPARILSLAGVLALSGCQLVFQPPELVLNDLKVSGMGLSGTSMTALLTVGNPNLFTVNTVRITYELTVDNKPAGKGVYDKPFVVPARGSVPLEFPMELSWGATFGGLGAALAKGEINAVTKGVITTKFFFGDLDVPYEIKSRIGEKKEPAAADPDKGPATH